MKIVVFGATGHTGKLVMEELKNRGVEAVGFGSRQVDVRDFEAVRQAVRGADGVANLAGPFLETGLGPARAAIDEGIPYVDTTGEQAFMMDMRRALGEPARKAGVALVNAMAYEYALSDLAVRDRLSEGGDALHVLYRNRGAQPSAGTKKSILRVLGARSLGYEQGHLVPVRSARYRHDFRTPSGTRTGVSFPGGEILTIPSHTSFKTVRTYVPAKNPTIARATARLAGPLMRGPVLKLAERIVDARHRAPQNEKARGEIHLLTETRHFRLETIDPYAATADICAEGITRLAAGARGAGVLAPAQALDARDTLKALRSLSVVETSK